MQEQMNQSVDERDDDRTPAMAIRIGVIIVLLAMCWAIWTWLPGWLETTALADYWLIVTTAAIVLTLSLAQFIHDKTGANPV